MSQLQYNCFMWYTAISAVWATYTMYEQFMNRDYRRLYPVRNPVDLAIKGIIHGCIWPADFFVTASVMMADDIPTYRR